MDFRGNVVGVGHAAVTTMLSTAVSCQLNQSMSIIFDPTLANPRLLKLSTNQEFRVMLRVTHMSFCPILEVNVAIKKISGLKQATSSLKLSFQAVFMLFCTDKMQVGILYYI